MTQRQLKAYNYFKQGYNCAESVVMAFSDVLGVQDTDLAKISRAFGGGFGRTRNLCGAVSGMGIVLGMAMPMQSDITEDKKEIYKNVQQVVAQFKERNGNDNCGVLLQNVKGITADYHPDVRDEEYYRVRPCVKFVLDAVDILEKKLELAD